jgi:tetratricopeptide (TPR) repeat protein
MGTIWKRQGQFDKAADILERASQMDPYNPTIPGELAVVYRSLGEFEKALEAMDRVLALAPSLGAKRIRVGITETWKGDLGPRRRLLEESGPGHEFNWAQLYGMERRFDEALAVLDSVRVDPDRSLRSAVNIALLQAQIHWVRGDTAKQREAVAGIVPLLEVRAETVELGHERLGMAYALSGRNEEALQQAEVALQGIPASLDMLAFVDVLYSVAQIHACVGDVPGAVQSLRRVFETDGSFTIHTIQLDFRWDPIRNRPEFRALVRHLETRA